VTHLALADDLLDLQLLRAVGSAPYGGADIGECLAVARRVRGTNLDSWYEAWSAAATAALGTAEQEIAAGHRESARLAYWRASTYFRTAGVMLMGTPLDHRLVESTARQADTFQRGAALLAAPPKLVRIPYQDTTLPGYLFTPEGGQGRRATVILTGGYDGSAEELYFANGAAALARGYTVLAFDGPGQGAALVSQGLVLRPDWESVVTPVLDFVLARPEVDAERVALIGWSLGAHLAPRAASVEHRLAACVADCGSFDLLDAAVARMPGFLRQAVDAERGLRRAALHRILLRLANRPTAGWALRRGQLVHGVSDPLEYILALREYSLRGRAGLITCPTLVCSAENDDISASAPQLLAELRCPKKHLIFADAEGAGDHCEVGARTLFHSRMFAWLDPLLRPDQQAVPR